MNETIAKMVKEYEEDSLIFGEATEEAIQNAENTLCLKFPKDYREFVKVYGSGGIGGVQIEGVEGNGASVVTATQRYRKLGLAESMLVVMDSGEFIDCLDTSESGSAVYRLYRTGAGLSDRRKDYDSFTEFVIDEFQEAIDNI